MLNIGKSWLYSKRLFENYLVSTLSRLLENLTGRRDSVF
jgi:hypothetical protein